MPYKSNKNLDADLIPKKEWSVNKLNIIQKLDAPKIMKSAQQVVTEWKGIIEALYKRCLLYTSPSPRDATLSRMPSSA